MKLQSISEKLLKHYKAREEITRINKHLKSTEEQLEACKKEYEEAKAIYQKELGDVEKLENRGIRYVYLTILGNRRSILDIENEELVWAVANLEKSRKKLDLLEYERKLLDKKLYLLDYDEEELIQLLEEKESILRKTPAVRPDLLLIDDKEERMIIQIDEIDEAQEACDILLHKLNALHHELNLIIISPSNYGNILYSFGGAGAGNFYKKRKYLERNIEFLGSIEISVQKLNVELQDLKKQHDVDLTKHLTTLNKFFELFVDNLITDFSLQKELKNSIGTVDQARHRVERLKKTLENEKGTVLSVIDDLKLKRTELIVYHMPG